MQYKYRIQATVYKGWRVEQKGSCALPSFHIYNFTVRGITRQEYYQWQQEYTDPAEFEDKVLEEAVIVKPEYDRDSSWDWDKCFAGVPDQVLNRIYSVSGWGPGPDPEVTEAAAKYINSEESRMDLVIMAAHPAYSLSDLMNLDHREYHLLLALSQLKLELMGVDSEAILYPDQVKNRKAAVAIPGGGQGQEQIGAQPFGDAQGKYQDSPYPPGHPKNPALTNDPHAGIIPQQQGAVAFRSGR